MTRLQVTRLPGWSERGLAAGIALGTSLFASGCHTYTPVESPPLGSIVRVHVPLTSALSNPNAPPQTVSIEGRVLSASDTISLATQTRREIGAFREIVEYDTLRLDVDGLAGMEIREFSTTRSLILTTVIVGGATGLALAALNIEVGGTGENGNGGGPVTLSSVVVRGLASTVWRLIGN